MGKKKITFKNFGRWVSVFIAAILLFLPACDVLDDYDPDQSWAVYWYLCGSDLETENGFATDDIIEMLDVDLPENVTVVIMAGGSKEWHIEGADISADNLNICVYNSEGFAVVDHWEQADMGSQETLEQFLGYCVDNYPADRQSVIFWNHGGGSVTGIAFDENYGMSSLDLNELESAFDNLGAQFELIGFDACLMATVDTAAVLSKYAKWMTASQEIEPGCGWDYAGLLAGLIANPGMDGAEFGKIICDTYYAGCEEIDRAEIATLSVIDLSEIPDLVTAYNDVGIEALSRVIESVDFFGEFGRAAFRAENYGGNNKSEGYTNMVDLGDLVREAGELLPETGDALLSALDKAVSYRVNGSYRSRASGLSCYYSYNGDPEDYNLYTELGASKAFAFYYGYELKGRPDGMLAEFLAEHDTEADNLITFGEIDGSDFEDHPVSVVDGHTAYMDLGAELAEKLVSVHFSLAYLDAETGAGLLLGTDSAVNADWEKGIFTDNFIGEWHALDGELLYMEVSDYTEEYLLYVSPVLLNGEKYTLNIALLFETGEYVILGARRGIHENGMAQKELRKLEAGDVVEPLLYLMMDLENSEDITETAVESVTITENSSVEKIELGNGAFLLFYDMYDFQGGNYFSAPIFFEIENGEITAIAE